MDSTETGKSYTSISSYFGLYFKTGGSRFIFDGGNVGIGTSSPSQKLHVSGNILATGIMTAAHFYESSDILLKENISSILGTDNIPILRKFNWKKDGKVGYGFIA